MHQLWKHSNGIWYVLYGDRLKKRLSARTRDRRQAETFLAQFIAGSQNPVVEAPTVGELLADYEKEHGAEVRSPDAIKFCVAPLARLLGPLQPAQLTPPVIKKYAKDRGAAAGTVLRDIGVLRAALAWAKAHQRLVDLPTIPNPVRAPRPRDRWLTKDEARRLLAACQEPHVRVFVALAVMTAARAGAILDLRWEQVKEGFIDYGEGHGNKRRAVVPINGELRRVLDAARELACSEFVVEFHGRRVVSVRNGFRAACRRAGLAGVTPHILRHSAATWAAMDGVPMREIARMLGDEEETVERVYAKHSPEYLRRAAASLQLGLAPKEP